MAPWKDAENNGRAPRPGRPEFSHTLKQAPPRIRSALSRAPCCLSCEFGAGGDSELWENVSKVNLDRSSSDEHSLSNLWIRQTLGNKFHDSQLRWRKALPAKTGTTSLSTGSRCVGNGLVHRELCAFCEYRLKRRSVELSSSEIDAVNPLLFMVGQSNQPGRCTNCVRGPEEAHGFERALSLGGNSGEGIK